MKDNIVENLESFSEELKISAWGWTTTEVVSTESTGNSYYPTIAADGSGNVHIAWEDHTDYDGSGTDEDIFYKRWNATTAAWTTTEVVSTESTSSSRYSTVVLDASGSVHIAWYDSTDYGGSGTDTDIFYKKLKSSPLNPSIIINNGDTSTDSTLVTLTLSADGAGEMCFRNGTTGAWTDWEAYATAKQLYLEGSVNNAEYSICVKFRNAVGETSPVCDDILFLITEDGNGDGGLEIPGYPVGCIIISLLAGIGVIMILNKSKRIKLRK